MLVGAPGSEVSTNPTFAIPSKSTALGGHDARRVGTRMIVREDSAGLFLVWNFCRLQSENVANVLGYALPTRRSIASAKSSGRSS